MKRLSSSFLALILLLTSVPAAQASARRKDYQRTSSDPENLELRKNPSSVEQAPTGSPQFGQYAFRNLVFTGPTSLWSYSKASDPSCNGRVAIFRMGKRADYTEIRITVAPIPYEYDAAQTDAYFTRTVTLNYSTHDQMFTDWFLPNYAPAGEPTDTMLLGLPARKYRFTAGTASGEAIYVPKGTALYSVRIISPAPTFDRDYLVYEEIVKTLAFAENKPAVSSSSSTSSASSKRGSLAKQRLEMRLQKQHRNFQ